MEEIELDVLDIDESNSLEETGFTYSQLLSLTAIESIHTKEELVGIEQYFHKHGNILIFDFQSSLIKQLEIFINLTDRTISLNKFISADKKKGISFQWVKYAVGAAMSLGFNYISLFAFGSLNDPDGYTGYLVWGKYGFLMVGAKYKVPFSELLEREKRKEKVLYELQCTEEGNELWKNQGFPWLGKFTTKADSTSLAIFQDVVKRKSN